MTTLASVLVKGLYANLPTSGMAGRIYYATDTNQTWYDDGTTWTNVTSDPPFPSGSGNKIIATPADGSAGVSTLRTMVPIDMPVMVGDTGAGGTEGAVPAPPAGAAAAGKYLKADGIWAVPASGSGGSGMTNPMTTEGDLIYGGASGAPERLAAGISGQVLQSNGSSAPPSWVAPSGGSGGGAGLVAPVEIDTGNSSIIGLKIKGASGSLTPAFIQGAVGVNNPAVVAFPSTVTAGSAIVLAIAAGYNFTISTLASITDTLGNVYSLLASTPHLFIYVALNSPAGANTVTVTETSGSFMGLAIHEYSNVAIASVLDASATAQMTESASTITVGPISTLGEDLLFTALYSGVAGGIGTGALGYTQREWQSSLAGCQVETADKVAVDNSYSAVWDTSNFTWVSGAGEAILVALIAAPTGFPSADLVDFQYPDGTVLSAVNGHGQFVLPATAGAPTNTPGPGASAFDPATKFCLG
jgi:hypothetical protein